MKTPSDQLFRLIKAMSPAEKRYFKKDKDANNNQTLDLFDLINEQEAYNEEGIKEKMSSDASFVKNLKIHKNRLQQLILKSLRAFNEESNVQARIRVMISDIEILLQKQLFDLAYQNITKAKELCLDYEAYELLLVVLGIEARWMSIFKEYGTAAETAMEEMEKYAEVVLNYVKYANVNQTLLAQLNRSNQSIYASPEYEKMIGSTIEKNILRPNLQPLSFVARRMHNHIFSMWYSSKGDMERAFEYTQSSLLQFEQNELLMQEKAVAYMSCLINHMMAALQIKDSKNLDENIQKALVFANKNNIPPGMKGYVYYCQFRIYIIEKKYQEAHLYWENSLLPFFEQTELISDNLYFLLRIHAFEVFMALAKTSEAGKLLLELTENRQPTLPEHLYVVYLLELIYHIEQKDMVFIDNLTAAHLKRLQRNQEKQHFFKWMVSFFRKWAGAPSNKDIKELLQQHQSQYLVFADSKLYRFFKDAFDYNTWLQAQMQGRSLAKWLQEVDK